MTSGEIQVSRFFLYCIHISLANFRMQTCEKQFFSYTFLKLLKNYILSFFVCLATNDNYKKIYAKKFRTGKVLVRGTKEQKAFHLLGSSAS